MKANHSNKLVPKLRFPEFRNAGEWEEKLLGDIGEIFTGKTPSTKNKKLWDGEILFITPTDILENNKYQTNTQRKLLKTKNLKILPVGSIIYTCIASIGKIAITKFFSTTNQQINSIITHDNINNELVYYLLLYLTPWIKSIPATSTLPIINKTEFSKIIINIPKNYKEQQKIADCLSSLDDLITAQTKKLETLKTHKKGLMQQLFPAENKTIPNLRFNEFKDAGEWNVEKLKNLVSVVVPPKKLPTNFYRIEGLFPIVDQSQKDICGRTNAKDALIFNGLPLIIFGDHTCTIKIINEPFVQGADGIKILKANNQIKSTYLFQNLQINPVVMQAYKRHFSILKEKLIFFPNIKEQQKIADCLSSLDDLITAQTKKLETLKTHKKGLMQQLFPNPDIKAV